MARLGGLQKEELMQKAVVLRGAVPRILLSALERVESHQTLNLSKGSLLAKAIRQRCSFRLWRYV